MAEAVLLKAEPRTLRGTGPAGRLRRTGWVPAVVYGGGKETAMIQMNGHEFEKFVHRHAGGHLVLDLEVTGQPPRKVLIKDVQYDALTGHVVHADFHEISLTRKLRVGVPLVLRGEPVGVTQQGGVLEHLIREVEVECLPTDIPARLEMDVSALEIGDSLTVADLKYDAAKFTVLTGKDIAVAAVAAPRAEVEEAPAAAEAAAAAGPEVITAKKEGEGEGAEGEGEKGKGEKAKAGEKAAAAPGAKPEAGEKKEKKPAGGKGG